MREYANTTASTDHRLASVLGWFIRWGIDDLRTLTEEVDDKYGSDHEPISPSSTEAQSRRRETHRPKVNTAADRIRRKA